MILMKLIYRWHNKYLFILIESPLDWLLLFVLN